MVGNQERVWTDKEYTKAIASAYYAGISEVVEWLNNHLINIDGNSYPAKVISSADYQRFQAKLKGWGIE